MHLLRHTKNNAIKVIQQTQSFHLIYEYVLVFNFRTEINMNGTHIHVLKSCKHKSLKHHLYSGLLHKMKIGRFSAFMRCGIVCSVYQQFQSNKYKTKIITYSTRVCQVSCVSKPATQVIVSRTSGDIVHHKSSCCPTII